MRKSSPLAAEPSRLSYGEHELAIQREREAWQKLFQFERNEPRYAIALAEWRAAADALITVTQRELIKHPKL
jgi:hypothetical protein